MGEEGRSSESWPKLRGHHVARNQIDEQFRPAAARRGELEQTITMPGPVGDGGG